MNAIQFLLGTTMGVILLGVSAFAFISFIALIITLYFAGPYGRFFLKQNLFGGAATFLGLDNSGGTKFYGVKPEDVFLRAGKKMFLFLPQVLNLVEDSEAMKAVAEDYRNTARLEDYNDLLKTKAVMNRRPLYVGTINTSVACTPALADAVAHAERDKLEGGSNSQVLKLLRQLKEYYDEGVREVNLVEPWDIDQLTSYVNVAYTDKDNEGVYNAALNDAQGMLGNQAKYVMLVAIAAFAIIGILVYWLN